MKVLIVAHGEPPSNALLRTLSNSTDKTFVVDGAINSIDTEIRVDVVCGDFDSIDIERAHHKFPEANFIPLKDQAANDLEKAITLARAHGAREIYLLGTLGKRGDQHLATFSLCQKLHREIKLSIFQDQEQFVLLSRDCIHQGKLSAWLEADQVISLIALAEGTVVSISGVRWPLTHERLDFGSRGVSNRALGGEQIEVTVHQGTVVCVYPNQVMIA